jgi:hypothetical protein
MSKIFISYRREDAPDAAGRIADRLIDHFGIGSIFFDIDTVPIGVDYRDHIDEVISSCDIVLVIIGDQWLSKDSDGVPFLHSDANWAHVEISAALKRGIPVVPVLVESAGLPEPEGLPESIRSLVFRNAVEVRTGRSFQGHVDRLIKEIDDYLQARRWQQEEFDQPANDNVEPGKFADTDKSGRPSHAEAENSREISETERSSTATKSSSTIAPDEGNVAEPKTWIFLSALLGAFVLESLPWDLMLPETDLNVPLWAWVVGKYAALFLSGWLAIPAISPRYRVLILFSIFGAMAGATVGWVLDGHAIFQIDLYLACILVMWAIFFIRDSVCAEQPAAVPTFYLMMMAILAGVFLEVRIEISDDLSSEFFASLYLVFILLCGVIGLVGDRRAVRTIGITIIVAACISEIAVYSDRLLEIDVGDWVFGWLFNFSLMGESLAILLLGWSLSARLWNSSPERLWLSSAAGLSGFAILGMLHTNAIIGEVSLAFPGSSTLTYCAIFASGWLYGRKAQSHAIAILVLFAAYTYWHVVWELAVAQDEEVLEEVVVTGARIRQGLNIVEVALLPVVAWLGEIFRRMWFAQDPHRMQERI